MNERWRTRRTRGVLLGLLGLAVTSWAYATLQPSSSAPITLQGEGFAIVSPQRDADSGSLGSGAAADTDQSAGSEWPQSQTSTADASRGSNRLLVGVGNVSGLYPGGHARLPIMIFNPNGFTAKVQRLQVRTTGTTACAGRYFKANRRALHKVRALAPHHTKRFRVDYRMKRSAPDGCQRAHVTVRVRVRAVAR